MMCAAFTLLHGFANGRAGLAGTTAVVFGLRRGVVQRRRLFRPNCLFETRCGRIRSVLGGPVPGEDQTFPGPDQAHKSVVAARRQFLGPHPRPTVFLTAPAPEIVECLPGVATESDLCRPID